MPRSHHSGRAPRWVLAPLVGALLVTASCTSEASTASLTTRPTIATTTTDPASALNPEQVVDALASDDADLADGETHRTTAQGDPEYEQEPSTLGYCSAELINEGSRFQRLEVQIVDGDDVHATIDAALYTPGRAASALRELRAGEMRCPAGQPVAPLAWEAETGPSTWTSRELPDDDVAGLADDLWARTITRTVAGTQPVTTTVIAQRRGDALVVVTAPDVGRALALAATAHDRLEQTDSFLIEG